MDRREFLTASAAAPLAALSPVASNVLLNQADAADLNAKWPCLQGAKSPWDKAVAFAAAAFRDMERLKVEPGRLVIEDTCSIVDDRMRPNRAMFVANGFSSKRYFTDEDGNNTILIDFDLRNDLLPGNLNFLILNENEERRAFYTKLYEDFDGVGKDRPAIRGVSGQEAGFSLVSIVYGNMQRILPATTRMGFYYLSWPDDVQQGLWTINGGGLMLQWGNDLAPGLTTHYVKKTAL